MGPIGVEARMQTSSDRRPPAPAGNALDEPNTFLDPKVAEEEGKRARKPGRAVA